MLFMHQEDNNENEIFKMDSKDVAASSHLRVTADCM